MAKRKKQAPDPQKSLDTFSKNRGRGRPGVRKLEIAGRGYHYRLLFGGIWEWAGEKLLQAKTEEDVLTALENHGDYRQELLPVASLIPKVTSDPKFPQGSEAQINFLADSLAGLGFVSFRRSRDICGQARAKQKKKTKYKIIRREFYVECTCGYKGPARYDACRKCGAEIPFYFGVIEGLGFR